MGFAVRKLDEIEPSTGEFEILADGDYRLGVAEISDLVATNDGTGGYVKFKFEVTDGERAGTPIWVNYNIENQKADTVERAWRDLAALGLATGVRGGGESDEFLHKTFMAKVGTQAGRTVNGKEYKPSNRITKYYPQGEAPAAAPPSAVRPVASQATKPAAAAPAAAGKPAPWRK